MRDFVRRFLSHDCGPFAQFVKYGAIGVAATCVQFAVFYLLASTCLKCLTPDDKAVKLLGLPSVVFSGAEQWYEARWFLAGVATAAGFVVADIPGLIEGASEGNGLGLALVKQILTVIGGTVDVTNNADGPGCTFRVLLPNR